MKKEYFNKIVSNFCNKHNLIFKDEIIGLIEHRFLDYKYYFYYNNTFKVYKVFNSKNDIIDFIKNYGE